MKNVSAKISQALLREELEFFILHCHEWLPAHKGQYVLLGKGTFAGFHTSYEAAAQAGVRAFGPVMPFLIRRIG